MALPLNLRCPTWEAARLHRRCEQWSSSPLARASGDCGVAQTSSHSHLALTRPRKDIWRKPRQARICPTEISGSVAICSASRCRPMARPWSCSFGRVSRPLHLDNKSHLTFFRGGHHLCRKGVASRGAAVETASRTQSICLKTINHRVDKSVCRGLEMVIVARQDELRRHRLFGLSRRAARPRRWR